VHTGTSFFPLRALSKSPTLVDMSEPLNKVINNVKLRWMFTFVVSVVLDFIVVSVNLFAQHNICVYYFTENFRSCYFFHSECIFLYTIVFMVYFPPLVH